MANYYPLESIKEVYTRTEGLNTILGAGSKMVVELNDGKRLECEFTGRSSSFGRDLADDMIGGMDAVMTSSTLRQKSVTHRWVNAVKDAISERKNLIDEKDKTFCRYCGNKNPSDSEFCEKCGKKIK